VVSGIQHSELIANQVRSEQAALLSAVRQEQLAAERAGYDAMLAQAAADAKSKVRRAARQRCILAQVVYCRSLLSIKQVGCCLTGRDHVNAVGMDASLLLLDHLCIGLRPQCDRCCMG
jgi:hypothetical protein